MGTTRKLRTVLLDANGANWKAIAIDTVLRGILRIPDRVLRAKLVSNQRLLRRAIGDRYEAASYIADWRDAFLKNRALDASVVNVSNLVEFRAARRAIGEADLVVVLHSATGDDVSLLNATAHWFEARRGRLCVFVGNEYSLMRQKKDFLRASGADFVCTQLPMDAAAWLYSDCDARVVEMPHALNPDQYRDEKLERRTELGFIGDLYDRTIGDTERTRLIRHVERLGERGEVRCDIRINARLPRARWAEFLNGCQAIVGAESGTYFLQKDGDAIQRANSYVKEHPDASFEEVFDACFRNAAECRNGKLVSSRHFEPIGTRTCQLLVEGRYSDVLVADEHYISVKKDLSNFGEALDRLLDETCRARIVKQAFEHAMSSHTHTHRVDALIERVTR